MPFKQYSGPQRTESEILVYVAAGEPVPQQVPFELQPYVPQDVWDARLPTIRDLSSKYYKKVFESLWFTIGFFSAIILPAVLYNVILQAMDRKNPQTFDAFDNRDQVDLAFEARGIALGLFVGIALFFLVPIAVWKFIGQRRANAMVGRWTRQDKTERSPNGFIPTWRVQMPGIFYSRCVIHVSTPPQTLPSVFHPDAYLPSYINGPADQGDAYYYPYKGNQPGMPHMSMIGTAPGRPGAGGNLPGYVAYGGEAEKYGSDEKTDKFDDVRV